MIKSSTSSSNSETELTEWETRMAKLVGLEESTPTDIDETFSQTQPDAPNESLTQQPLSAYPFAIAGLGGAGTLAVVMFAGGFLSQIMSNDKPESPQNTIATQISAQPETKPRLQRLEEEVEGLKTKLALSSQLEAVKAAQQKLRMVKPTTAKPRIAAKPTPEAKPRNNQRDLSMSMIRRQPQTPTTRTVYVPKIVKVEVPQTESKQVSQPVTQQPLPALPQIPPPPQSLVEIAPPEPNPMQEWARLAKLGSYGQVSINQNQTVRNRTPSEKVAVAREVKQKQTRTKPERRNRTSTSRRTVRKKPKITVIGTTAKAVLATAIYGETTKSGREDNENNHVYVVRLKQPLKAVDGTVALPVGSQILTKINSISENGFMELETVKIMMRDNGKLAERNVPQDALMIRGKAGKPLIANQYPNKGSSIARMDAGLFALGGLGKAAELINRTESEVVTGENGTVAVTNVNRNPDMAAGILEGGMRAVVPQISRRNQRAISQMSRKTNIWFLPPGKEVEVFVNQEMQF